MIWLTDRSRFIAGIQGCKQERFLEYYYGGFGLRLRARSMPMTTGIYVHQALAEILQACWDAGWTVCGDGHIYAAVEQAQKRYLAVCAERGFFKDDKAQEDSLEEQVQLVGALTYGWVRTRLPWLLNEYRPVAIEQELTTMLTCTCGIGAGVGTLEEHSNRDCNGICLMTRPDIILERVSDGVIGVHDFKTASEDSKNWREEWEESVQMALQVEGAQSICSKKVTHYYVHALIKGKRGQEYNPETRKYDLGPWTQKTSLLYAYFRPANPPLYKEHDWKIHYNYEDPKTGKGTNLKGKGYTKVPVWAAPPWSEQKHPMADWVAQLPLEELEEMFPVVGPLQRNERYTAEVLRDLRNEEEEWLERVRGYYALLESHLADAPEVAAYVDLHFRRSWNCKRWNRKCQFFDVCHGNFGLDSGEFELRTPHHEPELQRAKHYGYEFPDEGAQEGEG